MNVISGKANQIDKEEYQSKAKVYGTLFGKIKS